MREKIVEVEKAAERDAALAAFKPPYDPLLDDLQILNDLGSPDPRYVKNRRLMLVDGLEALRQLAILTGRVTVDELCNIIEAEREYANRDTNS